MKTITYWVAAATLAEGGVVARAIHKGKAPMMPWNASEEACQQHADKCNAMLGARMVTARAYPQEVEDNAPPSAWPVDKLGDAAAAFLITVVGPLMVGAYSLI